MSIFALMRIISLRTIKKFWENYPEAEPNLRHWHSKVSRSSYQSPQEVISHFKGANYVGNERIVFNIAWKKYRLVAAFNYEYQVCYLKFVGTHQQYDKIDAKTVEI